MKKKYIKPETKTIKIDNEPCITITSQHKEGSSYVCPCDKDSVKTIEDLINK